MSVRRAANLGIDVRGHLDDPSVPPPGGQGARLGARAQRDDGKRPRPAGVRRPRAGEAPSSPPRRPGHDPFLLGDDARRPATRSARRSRPAGGSACTATTTSTGSARPRSPSPRCATSAPTSTGTFRAASRRATASRARRSRGSPTRAAGSLLTVDCGITAVEEVAEAARARASSVVVTDHHRPGETLPDCPVVAHAPVGLPVPGALRHRRRLQAPPGARRAGPRAAPRPRRARHGRRRRSARGREPLPRRGRAAAPGPDRQARPARAHARGAASIRPPSTRARSAFRLAPRINAAGRLGHPRAALELLLTERRGRGRAARRRARDAEPRPPGGRGADPPRRDRARCEEWPEPAAAPPRLRARGRGLASRRDRHRRVAARRALRPAGRAARAGGGRTGSAPAARSRPSTCTARSARARST